MDPHDFVVLLAVGGLSLGAMVGAVLLVELIGLRRLADWLRLDIRDEDDR